MSGRSWFSNAQFSSAGMVFGAFGFQTTNIGSNPTAANMFGAGGLTGQDAASSVANGGPTFISSITKTANNGEFLVTLADGYRAVWFADGAIWGPNAGPGDGFTAQVCVPSNQGSGNTTAVTFLLTVCNGAGTPTETSGRTVSVFLALKNSGSGS